MDWGSTTTLPRAPVLGLIRGGLNNLVTDSNYFKQVFDPSHQMRQIVMASFNMSSHHLVRSSSTTPLKVSFNETRTTPKVGDILFKFIYSYKDIAQSIETKNLS